MEKFSFFFVFLIVEIGAQTFPIGYQPIPNCILNNLTQFGQPQLQAISSACIAACGNTNFQILIDDTNGCISDCDSKGIECLTPMNIPLMGNTPVPTPPNGYSLMPNCNAVFLNFDPSQQLSINAVCATSCQNQNFQNLVQIFDPTSCQNDCVAKGRVCWSPVSVPQSVATVVQTNTNAPPPGFEAIPDCDQNEIILFGVDAECAISCRLPSFLTDICIQDSSECTTKCTEWKRKCWNPVKLSCDQVNQA